MFYEKSDDKTELEVIDLKKIILLFLLIILSLNITGYFNNMAILDKPKSSVSAKVKCINKAWYKNINYVIVSKEELIVC